MASIQPGRIRLAICVTLLLLSGFSSVQAKVGSTTEARLKLLHSRLDALKQQVALKTEQIAQKEHEFELQASKLRKTMAKVENLIRHGRSPQKNNLVNLAQLSGAADEKTGPNVLQPELPNDSAQETYLALESIKTEVRRATQKALLMKEDLERVRKERAKLVTRFQDLVKADQQRDAAYSERVNLATETYELIRQKVTSPPYQNPKTQERIQYLLDLRRQNDLRELDKASLRANNHQAFEIEKDRRTLKGLHHHLKKEQQLSVLRDRIDSLRRQKQRILFSGDTPHNRVLLNQTRYQLLEALKENLLICRELAESCIDSRDEGHLSSHWAELVQAREEFLQEKNFDIKFNSHAPWKVFHHMISTTNYKLKSTASPGPQISRPHTIELPSQSQAHSSNQTNSKTTNPGKLAQPLNQTPQHVQVPQTKIIEEKGKPESNNGQAVPFQGGISARSQHQPSASITTGFTPNFRQPGQIAPQSNKPQQVQSNSIFPSPPVQRTHSAVIQHTAVPHPVPLSDDELVRAILVHDLVPDKQNGQRNVLSIWRELVPVVDQWIFEKRRDLSPAHYQKWVSDLLATLKTAAPEEVAKIKECQQALKTTPRLLVQRGKLN